MSKGNHSFTETGKMRRATHAEVCNWVIRAWIAVKVKAIMNDFRKAGITSVLGPPRMIHPKSAILDPVVDVQLIELFNS